MYIWSNQAIQIQSLTRFEAEMHYQAIFVCQFAETSEINQGEGLWRINFKVTPRPCFVLADGCERELKKDVELTTWQHGKLPFNTVS